MNKIKKSLVTFILVFTLLFTALCTCLNSSAKTYGHGSLEYSKKINKKAVFDNIIDDILSVTIGHKKIRPYVKMSLQENKNIKMYENKQKVAIPFPPNFEIFGKTLRSDEEYTELGYSREQQYYYDFLSNIYKYENIPSHSFENPSNADDRFILHSSIQSAPIILCLKNSTTGEMIFSSDKEYDEKYCSDLEEYIPYLNGNSIFYLEEHVHILEQEIFGSNILSTYNTSENDVIWKYIPEVGMYIPVKYEDINDYIPVLISEKQDDDKVILELALISKNKSPNDFSWEYEKDDRYKDLSVLDYAVKHAPKHKVTLIINDNGEPEYFAHELPE